MSLKQPPVIIKDTSAHIWINWFLDLWKLFRFDESGNVNLTDTGAVYLGDANTNNSWRMIRSGNNLVFQRRETGSWVTKGTYTP